jgi:hypothetical protein
MTLNGRHRISIIKMGNLFSNTPSKTFLIERGTTPDIHFGILEGVCRYWWPNGTIKKEVKYVGGDLVGFITEWYENGQIKTKGFYFTELVILYEGLDGDATTNKIVKDGVHLTWSQTGQLLSEITYEKDVPVAGSEWDESGNLVKTFERAIPNEQLVVQRETKHTCMILHDEIPSGGKYMLCSFSEEHVHDYNALQSFMWTARQTKATCQYCTNPMKEEIYQQP